MEILNAESAMSLKSIDLQFDGRISAVAITRSGKGVAVAISEAVVPAGSKPPTLLTAETIGSLATLNKTEQIQGSNLDVVRTQYLFDLSLAYDARGRHLILFAAFGHSEVVVICWDVITRGVVQLYGPREVKEYHSIFPIYNMPLNEDAIIEGFISGVDSHFSIGSITRGRSFRIDISFRSSYVFGVNNRSVSILANDNGFKVWDRRLQNWRKGKEYTLGDPEDKIIYKYLWNCAGKTSENTDFTFAGRVKWDDDLAQRQVKVLAETERGLALIMDNEQFVYFGKE